MQTGLRAGALATLTPQQFDFEAAVGRVAGRDTKNGDEAVQPLSPTAAEPLHPCLADKPASQPVWPGSWAVRAAAMIRRDAESAGIALTTDDGELVFYSLRHTYGTLVAADPGRACEPSKR